MGFPRDFPRALPKGSSKENLFHTVIFIKNIIL